MIKRILQALASNSRALLHSWRVLIVLLVLYLAVLGATYLSIATREATIGQLVLSFLLALAAPVLFLIIQTMAARYRDEKGAWQLFSRSLRDFWKLLVIVVPLVLIAVLAAYLFAKVEPSAPAGKIREVVRAVPAPSRATVPKPQPVHWLSVAITTLEYLLFCLVLPLAAIHLWIATARDGLKQTLKRSGRIVARAFAPQAVITYAIGFIFFAVVPYFLIVPTTHATNPWLEAGLLGARLALAVAFSLFGWVATVGALGELTTSSSRERVTQPGEGHVPVEA